MVRPNRGWINPLPASCSNYRSVDTRLGFTPGLLTMIAVFSFVLVVLVSMLVVRGGAVALKLTGLSWDVASFQAQSAFTGAGFTTSESENLISHPARRRVIKTMISLGSIGVSSALVTVVVTFTTAGDDMQQRTWWMIGSLVTLAAAIRTKALDKLFIPVVTRYLMRSSKLRILDYEELLRMDKGFSVAQLTIEPDTWLTGGPLQEQPGSDPDDCQQVRRPPDPT